MKKIRLAFNRFANIATKAAGSPTAFVMVLAIILIWLLTGPIFKFSNTWQLIINSTSSVVTFLMVFIIQQSQNKDTMALQLKLNELIAANKFASNRLIDIEDLTDEELEVIKKFYVRLSELAGKEIDLRKSHSYDEASSIHKMKLKPKGKKWDS
jgi:low affinity Fe/Cu permease